MSISFRNVAAVAAGLAVTIVLSNGTDTVLEKTGVFPPIRVQMVEGFTTSWMVTTALAYRVLILTVAGYVTAAIAPSRPIRHVVILGVLGTALGSLGTIAAGDIVPLWFTIGTLCAGLPAVLIGGRIRIWRSSHSRSPRPRQHTAPAAEPAAATGRAEPAGRSYDS